LASSATLAGGGAGGTFIPLVVQGAILGRLVAAVTGVSQVTLLPLVGAAAFLGAGYRVPITAVVFVAESTGRPGFIVPGVLATVVAQLFMGDASITPYQVKMRGGHVEQRLRLPVASAMREDWMPLRSEAPLDNRIEAAFLASKTLSLPVVDATDTYTGIVRLADVVAVRAGQRDGETVGDLVVKLPLTTPQTSLLEVVSRMDEAEVDCLAVADIDGIAGIVTRDDALQIDQILARSRGPDERSGGR
jgi:CBS domain-containing protein